ncbi:helix-turn-helix domain-containing protein [Pseudonocardia humida]|uniref:Helix-turn-helix domain-containing protein n=1 Tax=Pseudonocardia humida TaxID=2800819 RepID=A0ABT1ACY9_9PSEU|nr:helix-turn-helix domain-containing protein [Pseudonocardia humida]MCO1660915.1 helix-turn-helix domain-containing protein [Pseudonocardia humida]
MNAGLDGRAPTRAVFRTIDQPVDVREVRWRQVVLDNLGPYDIRRDGGLDVRDEILSLTVGGIRVSESSTGPGEARRTARHVVDSDPELVRMIVAVSGTVVGEHGGRSTELPPGDLVLIDLSRPLRCLHRTRRAVFVTFPRALLPLPELAPPAGIRIPGNQGSGALLSGLVRQLPRHADATVGASTARLGTAVLDLLTVALAEQTGDKVALPPATQAGDLRLRIGAFIESHLEDPDLSPARIAESHHISLRYLHRLFESTGDGVAGRIRQRRLERIRRDLLDPGQAHRPVYAIAARWGLGSAAHFNRLFREVYGMPPAEFRARFAPRTT